MGDNEQLSQELEALKQRLRMLEDKEEIRDLLARYSFNADLNRNDALVKLWTDDGVFNLESGIWKGRSQIKQMLEGPVHQSITKRSQHLMLDYKIDIHDDIAVAAGYVLVTVHWQGGFGIFRCGFRTFKFQRVEGRWLISESISRATENPECDSLIPRHW